jgi:hypothetical protein
MAASVSSTEAATRDALVRVFRWPVGMKAAVGDSPRRKAERRTFPAILPVLIKH